MKERMIFQSEAQIGGRVDLTPKANPYTLKVSAMPEQQEGPSQVNPVEKPQEMRGEYSSEQSSSVRAMWEKWAEGQPQDVGTTATINKLIELGIPPTLEEMGVKENPEDVATREEIIRKRKEEQLTPEPIFNVDPRFEVEDDEDKEPASTTDSNSKTEESSKEFSLPKSEAALRIISQRIDFLNDRREEGAKLDPEAVEALINKLYSIDYLDHSGYLSDKGISAEDVQKLESMRLILGEKLSKLRRISIPEDRKRAIERQQEEAGRNLLEKLKAGGNEAYDEIEKVINRQDDSSQEYMIPLMAMHEIVAENPELEHYYEFALEYGMERMLTRADITPGEPYPQFNLYQAQNLDSIVSLARQYDEAHSDTNNGEQKMFKYLSELRTKRHLIHELFREMKNREGYVRGVTEHLRSEGFAFVEKEIEGTAQVQREYERVLRYKLSLIGRDWLREEDFREADVQVEELLEEENQKGRLKQKIQHGYYEPTERSFRPWEVKRAALMGRGLSALSQRRSIFMLLGDMPTSVDKLISSTEFEFVARPLAPLKLTPDRFFTWGDARSFIHRLVEQYRRKNKYGVIKKGAKNGEEVGLYGKEVHSHAILDTGAKDPKSNSWRGRLLLTKSREYLSAVSNSGKKTSIGVYLEEQYADAFEKALGNHKEQKEIFQKAIAETVKKQRLNLGAILRWDDLGEDNKIAIWNTVVEVMPSITATSLPHEALEIVRDVYGFPKDTKTTRLVQTRTKIPEKTEELIEWHPEVLKEWDGIIKKIWTLERLRFDADALAVKEGKDGHDADSKLEDFYETVGMTDKEKEVLEKIVQLGKENVAIKDDKGSLIGGFAKITYPFTAFLDDVPETDWENLAEADLERIFVNDQTAFQEGYGNITALAANPGMKPEEAMKFLQGCFGKIESPFGKTGAQKAMGPILSAYLEMTKMREIAKWFSYPMRLMRKPRSEVEKFNLSVDLSNDERETAKFLAEAAQSRMISDDPTDEANTDSKTKMTQYQQLSKEHGADRKALMKHYVRLFIMIFGPVLGLEILKVLVGDLSSTIPKQT